jgi:hypothetical protein
MPVKTKHLSPCKNNTMKKLIVIAFVVALFSCNKGTSDEYYVKYEVSSSTIYTGGKLNVVVSAENSKNISTAIATRTLWETVVGPVEKGFDARLDVSCPTETYNHLTLQLQISVSKNGSPFALKKVDNSSTARSSATVGYTIDY